MTNEKAEFLLEQLLQGSWSLVETEEGKALLTEKPSTAHRIVATIDRKDSDAREEVLTPSSEIREDEAEPREGPHGLARSDIRTVENSS